mmetsp:Transcript_64558/g.173008  ORF Transcript_64558/g.173008 Transcript_64558/m.173008 type:complete len:205 (-) Transcript_64558:174-788(-)
MLFVRQVSDLLESVRPRKEGSGYSHVSSTCGLRMMNIERYKELKRMLNYALWLPTGGWMDLIDKELLEWRKSSRGLFKFPSSPEHQSQSDFDSFDKIDPLMLIRLIRNCDHVDMMPVGLKAKFGLSSNGTANGNHYQAVLSYFEDRFPHLVLGLYLFVEHCPLACLGQDSSVPGAAVRSLTRFDKYFPRAYDDADMAGRWLSRR